MHRLSFGALSALLLVAALACGTPPASTEDSSQAPATEAPATEASATEPSRVAQDEFWAHLTALCGQAFGGEIIEDSEPDSPLVGRAISMHVRHCTEQRIEIPFHIGEDRSRTWVLTRTEAGLELDHDHRHEDGSPDAVTLYGGTTEGPGTSTRQSFPADDDSRELFEANELAESVSNVWSLEIEPGQRFTYELERPGRYFRADLDLAVPIPAPPPPWGY